MAAMDTDDQKGRFALQNANVLGSGGYGKVVIAKDNVTGENVAAKIISTSRMKMTAIQKEVDLMEQLDHPNIIGLRGKEQMGKTMVIFMELANHGELFSKVIDAGSLTEDEARPFFRQLMEAVSYMHGKGVVHRDLKLENILLDASDVAKVCDFGLAHVYKKNPPESLREVCGSKSYCAPEVLEGRGYDGFPTDVWSCGICLFAMLAGFFPLDEASGADWRFERVKLAAQSGCSVTHTIFGFYERECTLSRGVTDLIDGMLVIHPSNRLTVDQVLQSPWCNGIAVGDSNAASPVYRSYNAGQFNASDADALRAMIAQESEEPMRPVYRGLASSGPPPAPPPPLRKQEMMFCAEFHEPEA